MTMDDRDKDRLELLDRLADRVPDLDLDKRQSSGANGPMTARRRSSSMGAGWMAATA